MAEIAAGALVAEQAVSTGVEAAAAYSVAKPTLPLKASLNQIAKAPTDDPSLGLARSHHTVTVVGNKAYLFGGEQIRDKLCSNAIHAVSLPTQESEAEYACYPAVPLEKAGSTDVPLPRFKHAACTRGKYVVVFGGCDSGGLPIDEDACLWLWDTEKMKWAKVTGKGLPEDTPTQKTPAARFDHHLFADDRSNNLILHGGQVSPSTPQTTETWLFDFDSHTWTELPSAPSEPSAAAFVDGTLYTIASVSDVSSDIHALKIGSSEEDRKALNAASWQTISFPTNPLTPGPRPRQGSALLPVTTGMGRQYLVFLFGYRQSFFEGTSSKEMTEDQSFYSDIWTLQLPSHGFKPTAVKDAIRSMLPGDQSGTFSWAEIDLQPTEQVEHEGKVHPGPIGFFGADVCSDGRSVVFWGGVNAKGEKEGDGWILKVE